MHESLMNFLKAVQQSRFMFYVNLCDLCVVYSHFFRGLSYTWFIRKTSVKVSHKDQNFSHFFYIYSHMIIFHPRNQRKMYVVV